MTISALVVTNSNEVVSARPTDITFGTEQTLNIFPSKVETADWAGAQHVLSQDLSDNALYQDFDAKNSTYVPQSNLVLPETVQIIDSSLPVPTIDEPATTTELNLVTPSTSTVDVVLPASNSTNTSAQVDDAKYVEVVEEVEEIEESPEEFEIEAEEELIEVESDELPVSEPEVPAVDEPVSFNVPLINDVANVFARATTLFPLAQLSITTSTNTEEEEIAELDLATTSSLHEDEIIEPDVPEIIDINSATTTESSSSTPATSEEQIHEIILSDFETAPLEPGQFINGMQLRLSLAAQLEEPASGTAPYIEVLFGDEDELKSVGIILLEDEISNAINGGYFLFALPGINDVKMLTDVSVVLRYHGDREDLDGMFLDAAWLELDTKTVTKDDLKKRGMPEKLQHLLAPEMSTLVSDQVNFKRDEDAVFNLRYNSQRNFLVKGFRKLIGSDLVEIESVSIKHKSGGAVSVEPEITVTKEGLLTIEIPREQLEKARPGSYSIELTLNEGNKEFVDTFDFQWGILSINPNKSEYQVGETAHISIGALTPNGHTICEANLDLYVTDPTGFVSKYVVEESGLCDGNNVTDVPDFSSLVPVTNGGVYDLYLERLDHDGSVLGFTTDTFNAVKNQSISIERTGPTRIYPPSPYPMTLTVSTTKSFSGTVTEVVPASFLVYNTEAEILSDGVTQWLTWDISILGAGVESVSYEFDAPDISPYLFNLGPARLDSDKESEVISVGDNATSSATTTSATDNGNVFIEHRRWQIASDAVGNMLLFWDDGASVPTDWVCVSCSSGDPFYQQFIMGSSTYNASSGAATHTHTVTASVLGSAAATTQTKGGTTISQTSHTHTLSPAVSTVSNFPEYRQLRVIRYNAAAGEPTTIPAGAIAVFDVASSSLPTGWNRYESQDGRYVYGETTIGTTGGSNDDVHNASGTTAAAAGATVGNNGPDGADGAAAGHTHTVDTNTATTSKEPPYIEVLLAELSSDASPVNSMIAMWTEDVDSGWLNVSETGQPFSNRFIKASTTYGATGGSETHTPADVTGVTSSGPNTTVTLAVSGTTGSDSNHTHSVNLTGFSTSTHLPPYNTVVFGKRLGTDPVYEQLSSLWYQNENLQTPVDPWPDDAVQSLDLAEREPITATSTPVKDGDEVRLRINVEVSNATSSAGAEFKLQFAAADVCSAASGWADVGDTSSSTIWRGYNNAIDDHTTLSTTTLASSTVVQTYEENGYSTTTPNDINNGEVGEWDFVLQHNGAAAGTNYCFRMVENDGTEFSTYTHYPRLFTNEAPTAPTLQKLFDNEKAPSSTPWFYFVSTDAEGETIHYQIQIDNNYDFGSPTIDNDTIDDASQFENQVLESDKAPFRQGEQIEFIPPSSLATSTYYWRVRAQDPDGSADWGSWSVIRSFTIDTTLTASAWHQTEDEQFDTNTLVGVETGSEEVDLITGSSTGTMTSGSISFADADLGTAWGSLDINETDTNDVLDYQIEYFDETETWTLIPDADLPENSTGISSSTSLLNLDTNVYSVIRVIADFTSNSGTPSLQDWTVSWGYRVETPTIAKLFPNEQTGTTTPTFQFTTTDPQDDELTYQVQWSTTPDFAASTTRTSDDTPPTGFINIDNGGDTDPFFSGDDIQFTIQPADALTGTTTYWWRVRAKDTTGDNAYSFWTEEQSFTVIPGTEVSTWFQTTEEQFDTNILSGTISLPSDSVSVATTATEAMIVYGEGTQDEPRYRQWDGDDLTSEGTMLDIEAPLKWAVVEAGTTREEYVAATIGTDADVNAQVFSTGAWGNLQEMTTSISNINARGIDITYETLSGDAMVAYCDGDADPGYYIWDGSGWNASGTIDVAETTDCEWIELASDPNSDEIIVITRGSDGNPYEAQVWNGSAWGTSTTQGSVTEVGHAGMAVEYEESGGQAVIVTSDGAPNRFEWNSWNGSAWNTSATQALGGDFEWGSLVRDVGSDELALCLVDDANDIAVARWSGSAWTVDDNLETSGDKTDPGFSCVFEDTATRDNYIMLTYSDAASTSYQTYNNTSWSSETNVNSIEDTATMQLVRTGDANILGTFFDDPNDTLRFSTWDGSSWSTTTNLETDASVGTSPFGQPYFMSPRNSGTEGTTVVSPGIDFNDGVGPYWQEYSWNDSQPGSSEARYYLQYQTATGSWAFIPDADLPGNGAGTTTGPYDLSSLNTVTYNVIRPYAELSCDGGNCPSISDWTVTWAGGINISGTIQEYDQSTNVTAGTVAVAVNGVLQTGKTSPITAGTWSIDNVTTFPGDIVTVFVTGALNVDESVGIARYDGQGDMDGMTLFERHVSIGSNDATTTPFTNADIGLYDFTNTEDVFFDLNGSVITYCADADCTDVELYIQSGAYYSPGGNFVTHDIENNGTLTATTTIELTGSWDNNATTTLTNSTIVFAATSTTEGVDNTGANSISFNNLVFGTTTGNATWVASSTLDVDGDLTVERGTLARSTTTITVAGDLTTGANGLWTGISTTTFDGNAAATWEDQNGTLQNVGYVVVDGVSKAVTLAGNVAAQSITIGANDTLDASASHYDITVYGDWDNQNNFVARNGEVFFSATSSGQDITTLGDAFYDLTFNGVSGEWSFTESTLLVNNDFTVSTGTVNMPTATTTIAGSFDATGGLFAPNNGVLYFTSSGGETITFDGGPFTNVANNMHFNGGGSWTFTDTNATNTADMFVTQGTVNFPSGVMAIGGTLIDAGGSFVGGTGTVSFYSTVAEVLTAGGSSFNNVIFDGTGSWSFTDTDVTATGDLIVTQGTLTLPSGTFYIGGSYDNNATVTAGAGTVEFDSTDTGETVDFGASSLSNVVFESTTGGWTITSSATTTGYFTLASSSDFTLNSGLVLSVSGIFTNSVGGASTTWTGSTLALESGDYSINAKTDSGDAYATLDIAAGTEVAMWNSTSTVYTVNSTGSLYSQDHNAVDGDLYIFGAYDNTAGNEYWSYATDFDGTDLTGGSERQADVRFASGASATFSSTTFEIIGDSAASTTIANQGAGNYVVTINQGTTTAQYYDFQDLGSTGVSLLQGAIVSTFGNGTYEVTAVGGSAITLSSTTIDANSAKQIFNVSFATSTAIAANNVSQTDGTPSSYWWFRNGYGNIYGEDKDNDTGDPGSVRFDDSSLVLTISGTVYSDDGGSPIIGGTCDGSTDVVRIMVDGVFSTTTSCSNVDGSYSAMGVTVIGDPTLTIYLSSASGGEIGSVITRTPTADITDMDIYANRVIVRHEDTDALSIANLAEYDFNDDPDLEFIAATTSDPDTLDVLAGNELFVWATTTFTPGGEVTLHGNAAANSYDGTLYINNGATFNAHGTTTLSIGGRLVLNSNSSFDAATTTVLMNATTTGKSVTSPSEVTFNDLDFNGVGGGWNIGADIQVDGDMTIATGTVTGTGDITLTAGDLTGNGVLSMGGGTTTMEATNNLGGTSAWTFYNLQLGDAVQTGTTTPLFTSTTTVSGAFTIATAHFLDAWGTEWDLAGTGNVFIEDGTFLEGTSTIRYSGAGSNVLSAQYYNLDINSGAGGQTYVMTGSGSIVDGDLTVGGDAASTLNLTSSDPLLDVNGDVLIRSNGTISASDTNDFTIAGSYDNNGTFTGNNGTLTFDGTSAETISAGNSSFSNVLIDATTGSFTVDEHATATDSWLLYNADAFTLSSGESLAVGNNFFNAVGGASTTWTGSTLRLYGSNDYSINAATTSDVYATLDVEDTTQARMWNSSASTYEVAATASLYSQDHTNVDGDLYIWGDYSKTNAADYWSYSTDFDGSDLTGGSERKVDVFMATSSSVTVTGGFLDVTGTSSASTTVQNQGSSNYSILIGGNASTSWQYYEIRDIDSSGLVLSGSPTVDTLSNGDIEVSINTGTAMTVGGTVITQNPAKNFNINRFALNGVASGFNVTATGTTVSSWRFTNHYGGRDGEAFDVDPDDDPGYVSWDDSAALITVSGNVYEDDTTSNYSECDDGTTENVALYVDGVLFDTTSCNSTTGAYSFSNVAYGVSDTLTVYITGETEDGVTVTQDPISNINGLDIYVNHVIIRHENTSPMTILDMEVWDSDDDANILFDAEDLATDTLVMPADTKLIIWTGKEFAPAGDVTVTNGGSETYGGSLELLDNSTWTGAGTEDLSVGGSMTLGTSATFDASNGTTTFTTTGGSRTIDVNAADFNNVAFTGSGSWTITDATLTVNSDYTQTAGTLTWPSGTSTFSGSLVASGGSFDANDGLTIFDGSSEVIELGGSDLVEVQFSGGNYTFNDTNATATESVIINSGDITMPSGILAVGGNFTNTGGTLTHNTSELALTSSTTATLLASTSDLYGVTFNGGATYTMSDNSLTLLDTLTIASGTVTLASGTLSIGGSFDASGGTFTNATGTILFNSADTGETIDPGSSSFYNVQFSAPTGGYTVTADATTTNNLVLASANTFIAQSGVTIEVNGVFMNSVGGSNTTWSGSTLFLDGANVYSINTKSDSGDQYDTLIIGVNSDLSMWHSAATTTTVDGSSSLYSQDNAATDGALYIFGDYHISTSTAYWSYATDFDGTDLSGGSERAVTVYHAENSTTTVDGGTLEMIGTSGNETTVTNQGSGTYDMGVSSGTFNAQYYAYRNLAAAGLDLSNTPVITSLSYGDFELAVDGGNLISLSSTTLNANASLIITGNRFATTTAITGDNVELTGTTSNAWTFTSHTGNLDGEDYDVDGVSACGSIRWADSACLLVQQTNYRWRNDDGGEGVPDSEWYHTSWDARKQVRIVNDDATTYTDAAIQLFVTYDSDMQADFDDLRFTDSSGTNTISYWMGSTTDSQIAEVWVEVPSLPSEDTATIFMYYNSPSANSSSSASTTFIAADDFEDGNISEYSGETGDFTVDGTFAHDGVYALDATSNETGRTESGGIYRLSPAVSQGETIRFKQYIDVSQSDETCTTFGIQTTGAPASNYGVCIDLNGTDRLVLVRDAVDSADTNPAVTLGTTTISASTGWHTFEVDWGTDNVIDVFLYTESGTLIATTSATDSNYTTGGFGFTFWFQHGGWDSFSSRPTLTTEPTVYFGVEQADGGATWKADQNTVAFYDVDDIARLRLSIENTGSGITNQQFLLEYAARGASPSCEAVSPASYATVPVQSSCGTSPVCMQSSTNVTNGGSTVDLLTDVSGSYVTGEVREDPSNKTGNLDIDQNEYNELEYVITPTINTVDEHLCFRVTNNGAELDTYLRVAQLTLRFEPSLGDITLNQNQIITLVPGATTTVYATGTVTDLNGYTDLLYASSTIYRTGVAGGASCTADNNNCYISSTPTTCLFTSCSGNSCVVECRADIYFHADPTDDGAYVGEEWQAFVEVEDMTGGYDFNSPMTGVELMTLRAIDVIGDIDYGALEVNNDTGAINASTTIENEGNVEADIEISGSDLTDGLNSVISAPQQKFATTTFTYSSCGGPCSALSSTTPVTIDVDLSKPTVDDPPVEDDVYWGIAVPIGVSSAAHQGLNVFTPVSP